MDAKDSKVVSLTIKFRKKCLVIFRFNLNLEFLTSSEISTCKKLMDDLNVCFLNYEEYLRKDEITEKTLDDLCSKYVK